MSHLEASVSYNWVFSSAEDYLRENDSDGEDLAANLKARAFYPGEALFALCEAVVSAVLGVIVSLSLLVPCCGFESRKTVALDLFERAGLSTLAFGMGLMGLFSPWATSQMVRSCVQENGFIPYQVRAEEAGARKAFFRGLATYLTNIQRTLEALPGTPDTTLYETGTTLSEHAFTLRENTQHLSVALQRMPYLYYTPGERATIGNVVPLAQTLYGPQMRETLEAIRDRAELTEPVFEGWETLSIQAKLELIEALVQKVNRKANLEQLDVHLDCAEPMLTHPPEAFARFLETEPAQAELAYRRAPTFEPTDRVVNFILGKLPLQIDATSPSDYRLCATNRVRLAELTRAKISEQDRAVREETEAQVRVLKTRYREEFERQAEVELVQGLAEQRAEVFIVAERVRNDVTLDAFLDRISAAERALQSTCTDDVAVYKRERLQQVQVREQAIREGVAAIQREVTQEYTQAARRARIALAVGYAQQKAQAVIKMDESASVDEMEARLESAGHRKNQAQSDIAELKRAAQSQIQAFEREVEEAYEQEARRQHFMLQVDLTGPFLERHEIHLEIPLPTLERNIEQARRALGSISADVTTHKKEREQAVEEGVAQLRRRVIEACQQTASRYHFRLPEGFAQEKADAYVIPIKGTLEEREETLQRAQRAPILFEDEICALKAKELLPIATAAKEEALGSQRVDVEADVIRSLRTLTHCNDWRNHFRTAYWKEAYRQVEKPSEFGLNRQRRIDDYQVATYRCRNYPHLEARRAEIKKELRAGSEMVSDSFIDSTVAGLSDSMYAALGHETFTYPFDPRPVIKEEEARIERGNGEAREGAVASFRAFLYQQTDERELPSFEGLISEFDRELRALSLRQSTEAYARALQECDVAKKRSTDVRALLGREFAQRREQNERALSEWRETATLFLQGQYKNYAPELERLGRKAEAALDQKPDAFARTIAAIDHELRTVCVARLAYQEAIVTYAYPEVIGMLSTELQRLFELPDDLEDAEQYKRGTHVRQNAAIAMQFVDLLQAEFVKRNSPLVDTKLEALRGVRVFLPVLNEKLDQWSLEEAQRYCDEMVKAWLLGERQQAWIQGIVDEVEAPTREANQAARKQAQQTYQRFASSIGWEGSQAVQEAIRAFSVALAEIGPLQPPSACEAVAQEWTSETQAAALREKVRQEKQAILQEQQERLRVLVEEYRDVVAATAKESFVALMREPYMQRFQALSRNDLTIPDRLSEWIRSTSLQFARENAEFDTTLPAEQQIARFQHLQKSIHSTESREALAMQVREIVMVEIVNLAHIIGEKTAQEGPLSGFIWEAVPERATLDHLNNAIQLMQVMGRWRHDIGQIAQERYQLQVPARWVENAAQMLLLHNLGELQLAGLIGLSPEEFSGHLRRWPSIDEHPELQELCQLAGLSLKRAEDVRRETATVSVREAQDRIRGELIREIGNPQLVEIILASLAQDRTGKEMPTARDVRRKALTIQELKWKAVKIANNYYKDELAKHLRAYDFDAPTLRKFIQDAIPRRILLNQEPMSEQLFERCLAQAKALKKVQANLDRMRDPHLRGTEIAKFEVLLDLLPPCFQKELREQYCAIRCQVILEVANSELRLKDSMGKLDVFLPTKTPTCQVLLPLLGLDMQHITLDPGVCYHYFRIFQDERWTKNVSPTHMQELIQDTFERMILLSPEVHIALAARATDQPFIDRIMGLTPKQVGMITAAMLLTRDNEGDLDNPTLALAEAHRSMAVMLGHAPDVARNMVKNRFRAIIIPCRKYLTDLPIFADLGKTFDGRDWKFVRGISRSKKHTDGWSYTAFGEEILTGEKTPLTTSQYQPGMGVAAHEWWHHMYNGGMSEGTAPNGAKLSDIRTEIKGLLETKQRQIREYEERQEVYPGWRYTTGELATCSYANSNEDEWGAEFATSFLEANGGFYPDRYTQKRIGSKKELARLGSEERKMSELYGAVLGADSVIPFTNPWTPHS